MAVVVIGDSDAFIRSRVYRCWLVESCLVDGFKKTPSRGEADRENGAVVFVLFCFICLVGLVSVGGALSSSFYHLHRYRYLPTYLPYDTFFSLWLVRLCVDSPLGGDIVSWFFTWYYKCSLWVPCLVNRIDVRLCFTMKRHHIVWLGINQATASEFSVLYVSSSCCYPAYSIFMDYKFLTPGSSSRSETGRQLEDLVKSIFLY